MRAVVRKPDNWHTPEVAMPGQTPFSSVVSIAPRRCSPLLPPRVILVILITCSTAMTGCAHFRLFGQRGPEAPVVFQGVPAADRFLATVRAANSSVEQLECDVKVTMDGLPTGASGTLLVERPRRLRLKVGVLGLTDSGVDIGSNDERFWIFNKSSLGGQTPAIYYATHADYEASALHQTLNLQPQWLIDALGLIDFDQWTDVEGPFQRNDGFLELRVTTPGATGDVHRLLTIDPRRGWIVQQAVYGPGNQLVAWSRSTRFRFYPEHNASLPGNVELNVVGPDRQTTRISVALHSHTINRLYVDPEFTWGMPQPADVPHVDLTRIDPASMTPPTTVAPATDDSAMYAPRPHRQARLRGFNLR